ncbi:MAG: hypothetical protein WDZ94_04935 [Patescibacteria group bacterium]
MNATQFKINQLRMTNIQKLLEGLVVLLGAIFITALLPQLLFKYLYADAALTETPMLLEYMSDVVFGFGMAYLVYIIAGAFNRGKQIVQLERQMMTGDDSDNTIQDETELKELEALVDEALASQKDTPKSTATKRKKSTRKTSKK